MRGCYSPPKRTKENEEAALAQFTREWAPCPIHVHIKTLMKLIKTKQIEWRDRMPFISPELHRWKINCEFRLSQNNKLTD